MLDTVVELMDKYLSEAGVITNIMLKSERSLFEGEEQNEMELFFAAQDEGWDDPLATIHLFPLPQEQLCEIEIEIQYIQTDSRYLEPFLLWEKAQQVVKDISFTEKRRYITPNRLVEVSFVMDFHLILETSEDDSKRVVMEQQIDRLSKQLKDLVGL